MLKKVAMNPDELIYGAKYIWIILDVYRLVSITDCRQGIVSDRGVWWFDEGLRGQLYGPIEFES